MYCFYAFLNKFHKNQHFSKISHIGKNTTHLIIRFLSRRIPLNENPNLYNPFFIIGSGRSGNTLIRAVLNNNSKISIPPESFVLSSIIKKHYIYSFLNWDEYSSLILGEFQKIPKEFPWNLDYNQIKMDLLNLKKEERSLAKIIDFIYTSHSNKTFPDFQVWGDKTPLNTLNLFWINKLFPNAKYINLIRDGRDVVNSYLKYGRYNNINEACRRWILSIKNVEKFKKINSNILNIKYEDFVTNPERKSIEICNFLGISYEDKMLEYHKNLNLMGDTLLSHHRNLKNPINQNSIGKWKNELSFREQAVVENLLYHYLKKYNYEI